MGAENKKGKTLSIGHSLHYPICCPPLQIELISKIVAQASFFDLLTLFRDGQDCFQKIRKLKFHPFGFQSRNLENIQD